MLNVYFGATWKNYMTVFLILLFTFSSLSDDDTKYFTVGITNTRLLLNILYFLTIKEHAVGNEYWDDSLAFRPIAVTLNYAKYRVYTKEWCGFKSLQEIYFSPYTGTTYAVSSGNCPSFSCSTSSSLLMLTAGLVSKMASQQEKAFWVLRFEVSRSVITVLREFRARFRKDAPCMVWLQCSVSFVHGLEKTHHARCVFSKPCTKLTLHCNHRSGHLKTEHTESLSLLRRHLENWPRCPAVSMRSELLVAHKKLGQLPLLTVYVVPM